MHRSNLNLVRNLTSISAYWKITICDIDSELAAVLNLSILKLPKAIQLRKLRLVPFRRLMLVGYCYVFHVRSLTIGTY